MSEQHNHTPDVEKNRLGDKVETQRVEIMIGGSEAQIMEPSPRPKAEGGWNGWMTVAGS